MKAQQTLRIAIVGAGSGGPSAAGLLAAQGHEVSLFEQSPEKLPVGAGFLLQPSGMAVLKQLGCLESLLPKVSKIDRLFCKNRSGSTLLNLPYHSLQDGLFGAGTHRASLLDTLLQQCDLRGVETQWDQEVIRTEQDPSSRHILTMKDGKKRGPYDLLILSDGARSRLRERCGIPFRADQYPWGALWFIGTRTKDFDTNTLWQCVDSTTRLTGFLPTGTSDDLLSLFWSIRIDQIEAWRATPLPRWKEQVLQLAPQAERFLEQIHSHSQMQVARYMDVRMKHWHADRLVVIGDAAHALSPQLGQGVNLALSDAAELADCVARYPLEEALPRFSQRRKRQLAFYQFSTRWLTPFFQSDYAGLARLRDFAFPLANRSLWINREMVASMAGLKTGFLSREEIPKLRPQSPRVDQRNRQ